MASRKRVRAAKVRFVRPDAAARARALGRFAGAVPRHFVDAEGESFFPAPHVCVDDDLDLDPEYPPQDYDEWFRDKDKNVVTARRRTIYVVGVDYPATSEPRVPAARSSQSAATASSSASAGAVAEPSASEIAPPAIDQLAAYIRAFYHGMPVKVLPTLPVVAWEDSKKKGKPGATGGGSAAASGSSGAKRKRSVSAAPPRPAAVGIRTSKSIVRVRVRASPDGVFDRQLNLNDVIDAVLEELPSDAYAIVGITPSDLYEVDETEVEEGGEIDVFTCGRAYGGSRVSVVSAARYNPCLDKMTGVTPDACWPLGSGTVLDKAAAAAAALSPPVSPHALAGTWLARMCRTAVHELGHCFHIDHCVFHACCMQGSAHLGEDMRQPPHLCPIDLRKVLQATGGEPVGRYRALLAFCALPEHADVPLLAGFAAWLTARLHFLEGSDAASSSSAAAASPAAE